MLDDTLEGGFSDAPVDSARAFRAALNAMARPGTIEGMSGAKAPAPVSEAAATLILTLCDPETPIYLAPGHDSEEIRTWIAFHTGAPVCDRAEAMFALGTWEALAPQTDFPIGHSEYPDTGTTLIVELPEISAQGAVLSGPGIKNKAALSLPELAFFQQNNRLFPLGVDCYFTAGTQLAALPRSTKVEAQ